MSDVKGFSDLQIDFELGRPFLPFQQLLAVLPPASKALLPMAYEVREGNLKKGILYLVWACRL